MEARLDAVVLLVLLKRILGVPSRSFWQEATLGSRRSRP